MFEVEPSPAARRGPKPKPDTRNNLVQAGLRMFHTGGYAATGIQGIVESVGVPKGSFYNHFASKEAFGVEVIDAYFARNQDKLRTMLCDADVAPLVRLEAYFDDRIEAFRAAGFVKGCLLGNISAEVADHSALVREHLVKHFGSWSGFFETCLAQAQEEGVIGDQLPAALLARFVLNSWEGALLRMRAEKSDAPLIEFKQVVFGRLLA
ncbi:TetR family transcriptional regulator C-terminal domain-containing protein [Mesorhizobium kowhaii]|uniref:TetR/AcrR family transcriptional regulator n=1 Tax=Mesorhizobium kowhaii TaxID=1300272 RepID=UPI0035E7538A